MRLPAFAALLAVAPAVMRAQEVEEPNEVRAFLGECAQSMGDVHTLRIEFVQTKTLKILRRPKKSHGTVYLKGERLHMVVLGEKGERETQLLVEKKEARLYYPRLALLEIYDLEDGAATPTPFPMFGADLRSLETSYAIELSRPAKGEVTLLMKPRAEESPIRQVRMRFRDQRVIEMEQVNRSGDKVVLEVRKYEVNPEIPEELMRLETPPGTKVVRPLQARKKAER